MYPEVWGNYGWHFLHTIAQHCNIKNCIVNNVDHFYNLIKSLRVLLPCFKCKEHYKTILSYRPLQKYKKPRRNDLIKSIYDIHEFVNRDLGKSSFQYQNVTKLYKNVDHDQIFKFIEICMNDLPETLSINDLEHIRIFFNSLKFIFPCEGCRIRLQRIINQNPLSFTNKEEVLDWYFKIKEKWENKHISPRNYLLLKFKNNNTFYITHIPHYNIHKIQNLFYNNGKLFANIQLSSKNLNKSNNMHVSLFPTITFQKNHEIEFAKMKNKLDIETFMKYTHLNPNSNIHFSYHK